MAALCIRLALVVLCASCTAVALADDTHPAELALSRGELERARRLTREALEAGTRSGEQLAPLYLLEARASAALHDAEATLRAFLRLLAVDPQFRLDRSAPDELRSPYLEARGFWAGEGGLALGATARLADDLSGVVLTVRDPASMAARVRLRVRLPGEAAFVETVRVPADESVVPVPKLREARELAYSLALLDEHGNRIWQLGSDAAPERLAAPPPVATASPAAAPAPAAPERSRVPWLVTGSLAVALGVGAAVGGAIAHARREQLASDWNAGQCSGQGSTRAELCAGERSRLSTMQVASTVLYGVGGAALVTGMVVLLLAPRRVRGVASERAALGCRGGPGELGLACAVGF